ncbi:lysophosphatidic acid receptor 6-like [Carcharodon carcharias]|uniref:lysophosphatidic acid receptor 6-like n=1 Tax=Carcharodon carcharias TaxID=13397 RepID=UPI001B7E38A9|nr:lysophosphatidic acid receptor 6-like [Carcharodon carcharias]XP_041034780.1 lysophosphatidic acid receptor 6-like [Carcharodon carcharias]XP_041034781.1 lysophosphatidic acid receptor 6-like [Carcharodon carcharias]XP_041034782.1 lysophosphatidic acid receptor 6-like [Carcharodon carcharias]
MANPTGLTPEADITLTQRGWSSGWSSYISVPTSIESAGGANLTDANNTRECEYSANFQYIMFPMVYSVVFVIGTVSNCCVLWYLFRKKDTFTPSNVFMVNLALIDLIFAALLPFKVAYHALENDWVFGDLVCKITGSLFFANMYGSTLFLTCICVDRYIAVVHPIRSLQLRRTRYGVLICCLIWLLLAASLLYLTIGQPLTSKFPDGKTACLENYSMSTWSEHISGISITAAVIGFFIPLVVIIICYPLIARKLLEHKTGTDTVHVVKRKALRMVLLVLVVFIICFVPYHLIQLIHTLRRIKVLCSCRLIQFTYSARRVTMALASLNSCLDPLIYSFASDTFKWRRLCCGEKPLLNIAFRTKPSTVGASSGQTIP